MAWLFGIVVVLVLGGIAAVAAGRGGAMAENDRDLLSGCVRNPRRFRHTDTRRSW